ncbi:hypothetical protein SAMN02745903_03569 [Pseudomonas sp. URMO17WK12:I5]|nr:hypothetical protein H040_03959 [Pseudomonas sp. URMO17WK12:I7]SMF44470.1 hypothetical protein SAMN02745903_03569 [Pseudomonas sp. URMO17WK12:I5]
MGATLAEALFSARQRSPKGWVISHRDSAVVRPVISLWELACRRLGCTAAPLHSPAEPQRQHPVIAPASRPRTRSFSALAICRVCTVFTNIPMPGSPALPQMYSSSVSSMPRSHWETYSRASGEGSLRLAWAGLGLGEGHHVFAVRDPAPMRSTAARVALDLIGAKDDAPHTPRPSSQTPGHMLHRLVSRQPPRP